MDGEPTDPAAATNYTRRLLGILICFAPAFLLLASLAASYTMPRHTGFVVLPILALLLAALNLYLVVGRPALYHWRHGSLDGMRNVSGVPLVGTCLVVTGGLLGFADRWAAVLGLVALALDLGGLPWFLVFTWHDRSLWDA
jgi:hypothetical protein